MALSAKEQVRYWGIGLLVLVALLWLLGDVLLPFVVGMAIAYFLDPVADRLEAWGLSRVIATTLITFCVLLVCIVLVVLLVPELVRQIAALVTSIPELVSSLAEFLTAKFPALMEADSPLRRGIQTVAEALSERSGDLANLVLTSAWSIIDALVFVVVAPVVAFYMLLDWDRMIAHIDSLLPRDHLETIRGLARDLDAVLAGFVRGQLSVCGILGVFYAVALMLVGLQFGLIVGLVAGLLTFIPYVGSIIGGVLSIGLALFQFWATPEWIVVVAVIFVIGQTVEGNFLTPKLVGSSVGLHPVWLIFALSAFGALMGFTGMLIAVPVAAMIGVFTRFFTRQYQGGRLYRGISGQEPDA